MVERSEQAHGGGTFAASAPPGNPAIRVHGRPSSALRIDGQRQPKPDPIAWLTLRDIDLAQVQRPVVVEDVSIDEFVRAGGDVPT